MLFSYCMTRSFLHSNSICLSVLFSLSKISQSLLHTNRFIQSCGIQMTQAEEFLEEFSIGKVTFLQIQWTFIQIKWKSFSLIVSSHEHSCFIQKIELNTFTCPLSNTQHLHGKAFAISRIAKMKLYNNSKVTFFSVNANQWTQREYIPQYSYLHARAC